MMNFWDTVENILVDRGVLQLPDNGCLGWGEASR